MRRRDAWLLAAAYVLLIVTNVLGWVRTNDALNRIEEDVCSLADLDVKSNVALLEVFGKQEGVDTKELDDSLDAYRLLEEAVAEECD